MMSVRHRHERPPAPTVHVIDIASEFIPNAFPCRASAKAEAHASNLAVSLICGLVGSVPPLPASAPTVAAITRMSVDRIAPRYHGAQ